MKRFAALFAIMFLGMFLASCRDDVKTGDTTKAEMEFTEKNQERLIKSVPPPQLQTSLERVNLKRYLEEINREDRISYIYLIDYGKIMAFYTIKGKVTYCSSKLTTRDQIITLGVGASTRGPATRHVVESPGLDGSYGPSEDAVFFWTTEGVLVQWRGNYMWCSEPLKMTTPPALVRQVK